MKWEIMDVVAFYGGVKWRTVELMFEDFFNLLNFFM